MIAANELRIGNIVQGKTDKIKLVIKDGEDIDDVIEYGTYEAIPLTTEILYDSGFDMFHTNPRLEYFFINKQGYYPFHIYTDRSINFYYNENLQIKSVHQLQNLFFALMEEELKINLQPSTADKLP